MTLRVRELTPEEQDQIKHLSQSRTAPARWVERARIIQLAREGLRVPAIAGRLQIGEDVVRQWLKRFNTHGVAGLDDAPRSGGTSHDLHGARDRGGGGHGAHRSQGAGPSLWVVDV